MDYDKIRDSANQRRAELLQRQLQIAEENKKRTEEEEQNKRELIGLDQILDGLDFVSGDILPELEPIGFTDNIRKILADTSVPLIPTQIRDSLQARGVSGSSSKNLLINVHKVLERIEPELVRTTTSDGKIAYKHKSAPGLPSNQTPVVDLVAALKKSLAEMEKATPESVRAQRRKTMGERLAQRRRERFLLQSAVARNNSEEKGE
jgi:hypothetical protein